MTSRANVMRKTGLTVPNETTGSDDPEWEVIHAALPCFMDAAGRGSSGMRTVVIDGGEEQVALRVAKVPAVTEGIRDGDYLDVLTGACAGRAFRIAEASPADQKKQLELPVVEERRPEEWA